MKLRLFTLPVNDSARVEEELNSFLQQKRIIAIDKHFVQDGLNSLWSVCVTWDEAKEKIPNRKSKIDYKEILDEQQFAQFAALRNVRKQLAEKEGVPVYALFTNEQLATMVKEQIESMSGLVKIEGIGEARLKKYGKFFLDALKSEREKNIHTPGASKTPDTQSLGL